CKNVSPMYPLLAYCTERTPAEAWHETIAVRWAMHVQDTGHCRHGNQSSLYRAGDFVARKVDKACRLADGAVVPDDSDVFDKSSQAINASFELVNRASVYRDSPLATAILPVLVVPKGMLWCARFRSDGTREGNVSQVSRVTLFIGAP